ncbi:peptidyl-dipeptidase [Sandarakinorhabdus cyanobacteriorum]|uniref:Peptidyl-dipeptidase n=1 Tax=Sandarakinorhabdus cyanobacteriorum TaxID=1981098 RepID=A0A255YC11_9SPHN|nr:M2 family metallopeptidase [Sandarakinorhabdus cyanobacteriorum]OYQ26752.1 peptidyl-dipeptidase [Sandarakinorhabdus cyanobacteriorum]
MKSSHLALAVALLLPTAAQAAEPDVAEAKAFVASAEAQLSAYADRAQRVAWVNATHITDDTDAMAAEAGAEGTLLQVKLAKEAARFNSVTGLDADTARKLFLLRQAIVLPAPETPGAAKELAEIATRLQSTYGKGKGTARGKDTVGNDLEALMGTERDPKVLQEMWESWHKVGTPMAADYARLVEIANAGAKELGFADTGAMWRAGYDMPAADFEKLIDRLLAEVMPLYVDLHCYTRAKLNQKYGDAVQPKTGPIRADLLGNMWAQEWASIYDVVAPAGAGEVGYDIGDLLTAKKAGPIEMVKYGENFYSSLGFAPLPGTFWTRSQFTKPADREVVCHASAWDIDNKDDLRIKMCIKVNATDFVTIHHELGHNYYQRAYKAQPFLYLNSANDGFHEAIGDWAALNVTPEYLVKVGLLDPAKVPDASRDVGLLLRQAMEKVPGMPWTALVDKWRWGVFAGTTKPADYNKAWIDLRLKYQGIIPPGERPADAFDPGAKYHIPGNTPYARYFLARILQFQFYEAACAQAGWTGPLHRCSVFGDKAVGTRLNAMLEMGMSKPWPEALAAFTGTREMSGKAMLAYFAPLHAWLKQQNKGQKCGWGTAKS